MFFTSLGFQIRLMELNEFEVDSRAIVAFPPSTFCFVGRCPSENRKVFWQFFAKNPPLPSRSRRTLCSSFCPFRWTDQGPAKVTCVPCTGPAIAICIHSVKLLLMRTIVCQLLLGGYVLCSLFFTMDKTTGISAWWLFFCGGLFFLRTQFSY